MSQYNDANEKNRSPFSVRTYWGPIEEVAIILLESAGKYYEKFVWLINLINEEVGFSRTTGALRRRKHRTLVQLERYV